MGNKLTPSQEAYNIIKQWEGLSLRACKAIKEEKYYTIGFGHYGKDVHKGDLISLSQAEELLQQDVTRLSLLLADSCPALNQRQFDAICSLIYNIGWYAFRHSTTYNAILQLGSTKEPIDVARRMVLWTRAGGKVLLGLQRRRIYEANYFLGYIHFILRDGSIEEIDD